MLQEYRHAGLSFRYPSSWELTEESTDLRRTITLQTAGASFWTLSVFEERTHPDEMLASVVRAFQEEYADVDVYSVPSNVAWHPAAAADLDFLYLDTVTSVTIRAFQTEVLSAVVMYQGTDRELKDLRDQFDAVTASLEFQGEA
jgi:hypothetical protein